MNALNILSGISATPPPTPPRSRTSSSANINDARRSSSDTALLSASSPLRQSDPDQDADTGSFGSDAALDEKAPLLQQNEQDVDSFTPESQMSRFWRIPKQIAGAFVASIKLVLATIIAPGRFVVACFYDEQGNLSVMVPIRGMFRSQRRKSSSQRSGVTRSIEEKEGYYEKPRLRPKEERRNSETTQGDAYTERSLSVDSNATATSEPESEAPKSADLEDSPARNTRSKTASKGEIAPAKKSIRIKLHNEEALKRKRQQSKSISSTGSQEDKVAAVANSLKSPSSPAVSKLKYPRAPAAPRPLVPRRQPSYTFTHITETPKKTLIIDLDETLIHSMAKGGRMSTGHMVEVKFQGQIGESVVGSQVPILYYVHERPFCHEFLRKVR